MALSLIARAQAPVALALFFAAGVGISCTLVPGGAPPSTAPAGLSTGHAEPEADENSPAKIAAATAYIEALAAGDIESASALLAPAAQPSISPRLQALAEAFAPCAPSTKRFRASPREEVHVQFDPPCGNRRAVAQAEYQGNQRLDMVLGSLSGDPPVAECAINLAEVSDQFRVWSIPNC